MGTVNEERVYEARVRDSYDTVCLTGIGGTKCLPLPEPATIPAASVLFDVQ